MAKQRRSRAPTANLPLPKAPTGIQGLDEVTGGGLPAGRPTLVCGGAGCGKTMLASEFLVHGVLRYDEPGVFMMFEENVDELVANTCSLGFDLAGLQEQGKIVMDYVRVERSEIEETGEYDLDGLFIRLGHAIDSIGARRVVLDTIEALFAGIPNHSILRAELRRLFRWLKDRGITAVITGERGEGSLTRFGLEEYVADCVILLDHRIIEQVSTRRLRVLKYRGSAHGTNEYPFLIGEKGISVLPITSLRLDHVALAERVPTGVHGLDLMLGGSGVYRGSSILVSGTPGTGKSSLGASFADAACRRGESVILFAYEESASQLLRNMRSIGIDLEPWVNKGLLQIHSSRPTLHGLEQHLVQIYDLVQTGKPGLVVVDPISNLSLDHNDLALKPTLMRLIDFLKHQGTTAVFTSLTAETSEPIATSEVGVSSLMDSWLLLKNVEFNGERTRTIQVLKSRGMPHSNQVREFVLSDGGVDIIDVYLSGNDVLTGTARISRMSQEDAASAMRTQDHERRRRQLALHRQAIDAQIAALNADADERSNEVEYLISRERFEAESSANRTRTLGTTEFPITPPRAGKKRRRR